MHATGAVHIPAPRVDPLVVQHPATSRIFVPSSSSSPIRALARSIASSSSPLSSTRQSPSRIFSSSRSRSIRKDFRVRCLGQADKEMTGEVSGAAAYPLRRCKTVHLVRHGQGYHNVAGEIDRAAYMSPEYFDASLTAKGWQQVSALRNHVRKVGIADKLQLVVVSPLTRTMQTAVGAFGGEDLLNGNIAETPLMVDGVGMEKHKAISSAGAPPFVAVEWCREHMGLHPCDQRQSITTYRSLFPAIDFLDVEEEEDVLWSPTERETDDQIFGRARKFVQWILKRKETDIAVVSHSGFIFQLMRAIYDEQCSSTLHNELRTQYVLLNQRHVYSGFSSFAHRLLKRKETEIAVVSHSSFLWHLMATFGDACSTQVKSELQNYFANCELRSVLLVDRRAEGEFKENSDFPGGIPTGADAPSDTAEA